MRQNLERLLEDEDGADNILAREMAFGDVEKFKRDSSTQRSSKGFHYTVRINVCAYSDSSGRSSRYDS